MTDHDKKLIRNSTAEFLIFMGYSVSPLGHTGADRVCHQGLCAG
jgi:hypothetical protein